MPVFAVLALAQDILIIIYCSVKALVTQMDRKTYTKKDGGGALEIQRSKKKAPTFLLSEQSTIRASCGAELAKHIQFSTIHSYQTATVPTCPLKTKDTRAK